MAGVEYPCGVRSEGVPGSARGATLPVWAGNIGRRPGECADRSTVGHCQCSGSACQGHSALSNRPGPRPPPPAPSPPAHPASLMASLFHAVFSCCLRGRGDDSPVRIASLCSFFLCPLMHPAARPGRKHSVHPSCRRSSAVRLSFPTLCFLADRRAPNPSSGPGTTPSTTKR